MKVRVVDFDLAALEFVAHFLGIATHDNVNAPPLVKAAPKGAVR